MCVQGLAKLLCIVSFRRPIGIRPYNEDSATNLYRAVLMMGKHILQVVHSSELQHAEPLRLSISSLDNLRIADRNYPCKRRLQLLERAVIREVADIELLGIEGHLNELLFACSLKLHYKESEEIGI
eukprot:XP_001704806.1 Hypothetical protein GL50803_20889 [Giardia lamblia ATCC 50803]